MELKITVDVGKRRLGRRSEAAANNQPTFMAGGAARERACDEECRAPLPNADFGSGEGGRGTVNSARTLTNHKLYFRSVDGGLAARLARLVFVRRTRSPSLYFEHVNVSQAQREMMMIRSGLTDDVD